MRRLTTKETINVTMRLKEHPYDVTGAKDWTAAANRVGAAIGCEVSPKSVARIATALELRPTYENASPLAKLWDKVSRLEAEVAALKAEGGAK